MDYLWEGDLKWKTFFFFGYTQRNKRKKENVNNKLLTLYEAGLIKSAILPGVICNLENPLPTRSSDWHHFFGGGGG